MKRLIGLYPKIWRQRYGEEFEAILESQTLTLALLLDLLRGALDAHLFPQVPTETTLVGGVGIMTQADRWTRRIGLLLLMPTALYLSYYLLFLLQVAPHPSAWTGDAGSALSVLNSVVSLLLICQMLALFSFGSRWLVSRFRTGGAVSAPKGLIWTTLALFTLLMLHAVTEHVSIFA